MENKKVALNGRFLWVTLSVLTIAVVIGILWNLSNAKHGDSTLTIARDGEAIRVFSLEEIQAMPYIETEKTIVSSSYENESAVFKGVELSYLLNKVDQSLLKECKKFITRAEDGYASAVSADEVLLEGNVLVVYAKDGESLGDYKNGGSGPMRLLIINDEFGNRATRYLNEIDGK